MFVKPKGKRPKKVILGANDELVSLQIKVPNKDRNELREEAFRKKVSQSSIMRRVLKDHFIDEKQRRKELGVKLEAILDSCVGWFGGFEIDGEAGFVEKMYAEGLMLNDLTDVQWERVKEHLQIGYNGYGGSVSDYIFNGKFLKLNPSEKQRAWFGYKKDSEESQVINDEIKEEDLINRIKKTELSKGNIELEKEVEDLEGEGEDLDEEEGEEEEEKIEVELVEE